MTENPTNDGMRILENMKLWDHNFRSGWLAEFVNTGIIDWKLYNPPKNKSTICGKGIDLRNSRLMLISSAGAYLTDSQQPFDASKSTWRLHSSETAAIDSIQGPCIRSRTLR